MAVNNIEISEVNIFPSKSPNKNSKVVAFARVILNECFVITGIKVINGSKGLFIAFPQDYNKSKGKGFDIVYPMDGALRTYFNELVVGKYEDVLREQS